MYDMAAAVRLNLNIKRFRHHKQEVQPRVDCQGRWIMAMSCRFWLRACSPADDDEIQRVLGHKKTNAHIICNH